MVKPSNGVRSVRLEKLIVDTPTLFPTFNNYIEGHERFDKWNNFVQRVYSMKKMMNKLVTRATSKTHCDLDDAPQDLTPICNASSKSYCYKSMIMFHYCLLIITGHTCTVISDMLVDDKHKDCANDNLKLSRPPPPSTTLSV